MTENGVDILLVEDNRYDEELTLDTFRRNHLTNRIHVARDGVEALDFLFHTGPHAGRDSDDQLKVILLDLKLPKVDGLEVLRQVKADLRTRMIPVVALTSSREERDLIESYQRGIHSYIVKPLDFAQFTEAVRQLGLYWTLLNEAPVRPPSR